MSDIIEIGDKIVPNELYLVHNPEIAARFGIKSGQIYEVVEVDTLMGLTGAVIVKTSEGVELDVAEARDLDLWCIFMDTDFIRIIKG